MSQVTPQNADLPLTARGSRKRTKKGTFSAVRNALDESGYARFIINDRNLDLPPGTFKRFAQEVCDGLVASPDPWDKEGCRNRQFGKYVTDPECRFLHPFDRHFFQGRPYTFYEQDAGYQPELGNVRRRLCGLAEQWMFSPVVHAIVRCNFNLALAAGILTDCPGFLVGVHLNQQAPTGRRKAMVTPNVLHCDGEPITFAHLLGRANVEGGWTAVSVLSAVGKHPDHVASSDILTRFTALRPGESYAVDDARVGHHADGVYAVNPDRFAHRTMMLVDFRPMRPLLTRDLSPMAGPTLSGSDAPA